jgi:hypothetical protein
MKKIRNLPFKFYHLSGLYYTLSKNQFWKYHLCSTHHLINRNPLLCEVILCLLSSIHYLVTWKALMCNVISCFVKIKFKSCKPTSNTFFLKVNLLSKMDFILTARINIIHVLLWKKKSQEIFCDVIGTQ